MDDHLEPVTEPALPSSGHPIGGLPITPISRLRIMSPGDWEDMITEWASAALAGKYDRVVRRGGAGDLGRDVIGFYSEGSDEFDIYQAKHYNHGIRPSDIWVELGKLCYYTHIGEYKIPKSYYIVGPQGVGIDLGKLIEKPKDFRNGLLKAWNKYCKKGITSTAEIELTEELKGHIENIDFAIIKELPPQNLIDEHGKTKYFAFRFGGGLPARPEVGPVPESLDAEEMIYVGQLFNVYGEESGRHVSCLDTLEAASPKFADHLKHSRIAFYSAQFLKTFSRDAFGENCFSLLQQDIMDGIREVLNDEYQSSYKRLTSTTKHAKQVDTSSNPLNYATRPRDKEGVCHLLVNDDEFRWWQ